MATRKVKPAKVMQVREGKLVPMKMRKDGWPEPPFLMNDTTAYIAKPIIVLERSVKAWRGVAWGFEASVVVDRVMEDRYCSAEPSRGARFHWQSPASCNFASDVTHTHLANIRAQALDGGATPEAIKLLGAIKPFTEEEIEVMTAKLAKKKDPAPKADKKADKKATEAKAKPKGNPEALKKAREAREAGPDTRKITVVEKKNPYREGSNRAASWDALKGAKTAQDYKDAGGKAKYLSRWAEEGLIKLG